MGNMDIGLMYAIVAFIGSVIHGIILNRTRSTRFKEAIDRPFCRLLVFFLFFGLVDGVWGLFFSRAFFTNAAGYRIITYGFHAMAALSAYVWSGYIIRLVKADRKITAASRIIRLFLIVSQFTILFLNIWTHQAFVVDDQAVYSTGPLRTVLFWLQFSYYILVFAYVLVSFFVRKNITRSLSLAALIFSFIPLVAGVCQLIFPDAPMYSIGFMVSAVTIYSFNITSQRESILEKSLSDENSRLQTILSGLSEDFRIAVLVDPVSELYDSYLSREGNIVRTAQGKNFFGEGVDSLKESVHPEDLADLTAHLTPAAIAYELSDKQSFSFTVRMKNGDSFLYFLVKVIRSAVGDQERILIGFFDDDRNVRQKMRYQEELEEARRVAESGNRAKSSFLFNMSHDIRTPMNAIIGFNNIALKNMESHPEKAQEALLKSQSASSHLLSIINDVLDMSRIESGKVSLETKSMSLEHCFTELMDMVHTLADTKNLSLIRREEPLTHDLVLADEMHLNRILLNIFSNSVKYTPPGGSVFYRISEKPIPDEEASVYEFVVQDTGLGMSPEFLSHIFESFSREKNSTTSGIQGTGLGMAITKSLVELMNGTIRIESEPNAGTTVTITLPLPWASEDASPEESTESPAESLKGKRVLLVEDNPLNREIAMDILNDFGMVTDTAEDGIPAVEKIRALLSDTSLPRYDLILMDIQMPTMDGYAATGAIRAFSDDYARTVPIIAMTANVFAEDIQKALSSGMNAHVAKPIEVGTLVRVMNGLLNPPPGFFRSR